MDRLTRNDLKNLVQSQDPPCVSIYLPTHRAGTEVQQDPIRFKNLLQQAEDRLTQSGRSTKQTQQMLEQAENQLLLNTSFWQQGSNGLAVFLSPDQLRAYRLPLTFDEMVVVGDQYYVTPLFKLFQDEGRFYILALSKNEVRLLEGTKYEVEALSLDDVPSSLAEALKWDDPEKQLQQHTVSRDGNQGGVGRPETTFHGHGVGTDDEKTNLLRYFHKVDQGLQNYLAEERIPLLLAGVDYLLPIYREASSYRYLAEEAITGNPENQRDEELHAEAWKLLEKEFKRVQENAVQQYQQQAGTEGRASDQIAEIVQAAYGGRVSHLLIRENAEVWGRYDRSTNQVTVVEDRERSDEDLINAAACDTFLNGGDVFVLHAEQMPGKSPVAAVFRY